MADYRITNLAQTLVNYSNKVKPGDWVLIQSDLDAFPLVEEVVREVVKAGGNPDVRFVSSDLDRIRLAEGTQEQLEWISPIEKDVIEKIDSMIVIQAPNNTRTLTGVDPANMQIMQKARSELTALFFKRGLSGDLPWVMTNFPCHALAQEADMSLSEYEDFVYKATYADKDDPVSEWKRIHDEQERLVNWLKGKKDVVVRGPECDLTLSIEGRTFINCDGTLNMPDGEIFTGPVEDSVNGWIKFSYPGITQGREVIGVRLEFVDGKVTKATADKNQEFLLSQLELDEGAKYVGEFAIGTNYSITKFTKSILFDEKIGGSLHMAVGQGIPETGSVNKSILHWDFINDMHDDSEIIIDGELFYMNGQFQV